MKDQVKVLITGGAGYVGSVLTGLLLDKGYDVRVLDRMVYGVQPLLAYAGNERLKIQRGDVRDDVDVSKALDGVDVVAHLAAIVGYPACAADPDVAKDINVYGTSVLLRNMKEGQKIIFASTGSVYGKVNGEVDEGQVPAPLSSYGEHKVACEKMIQDSDIPFVILRFATLFGLSTRMRLDLLVNDFVHKAVHQKQIILYEGEFKRTFLHVLDACRAYYLIMRNFDQAQGQIFNVGIREMNFSKKEIARLIQKYTTYYLHEADIGHDVDQRDYVVNYTKIRRLGFHATVSIDDSIMRMIKILGMFEESSVFRNA